MIAMNTILCSLVLFPAAALAQSPDHDQGPNTRTEGEPVQIPPGGLLNDKYIADLVVFDRPTAVNAFTVYVVPNPGPVPGSALGLRAFVLDVTPGSPQVAAAHYWVLLRSGDDRAYSLATVRGSRDDRSYKGHRVSGVRTLGQCSGDAMMHIGSVPEPASLVVLGLSPTVWRRRRRHG